MRAPPTWTWLCLPLVALVYLALAWPGADQRGVIAEEVTPYLPRHPLVLTATDDGVTPLPPHASPTTSPSEPSPEPRLTPTLAPSTPSLAPAHEPRPAPTSKPPPPETATATPGWVRTAQWPNLAYHGEQRTWPLLIRGYQSALGTYLGIALAPALGDGITGIRRSSVLLGLALLLLLAALARRLGHTRPATAFAVLLCALSPGLLFFSRTGYGFELASRVAMLLALVCAAPRIPLTTRRALLLAACITLAILSRATIAATLLPALAVLLVHPQRRPGPRALVLTGLGFVLPVLILLTISAALGMAPGTDPTAKLALDPLAARTLLAPSTLLAQLAWVVDGRTILGPLLRSSDVHLSLTALLPGLVVLLLAAHRWWHARAGDGECMFLAAALGNALFGAWLYGDPQQFQLGMALEPLFALALVSQLATLPSRPLLLTGALVLALRTYQTFDLLHAERTTDNPMLSGTAQRDLVAALPPDVTVLTTAYNHVGMLETWSNGQLRPIHAWRALRAHSDPAAIPRTWSAILRTYRPRYIVLSVGPNLFEGPYTDHQAVRQGLDAALAATHRRPRHTYSFPCESGAPCLELLELK